MKRGHILEVGYMRGLAMLAVVMVHVTAVTYHMFDTNSGAYPIYAFLNRFFRFGTPTFIFITGLVMFYGYYYKTINKMFLKKYFRNRLLFIFVPYTLWVVLYEIHSWTTFNQFDLNTNYVTELFVLYFQGNTFYHLYFFFVLIQLYLLFPLILAGVQKFKWFRLSLPLIGLVVQLTVYVTNYYYSWLPASTSYFMSFFFYFCLGGLIGIYFEKVIAVFRKTYAKWLLAVMFGVGLLYVYMYHLLRWGQHSFPPLYFEYMYFAFASLSVITLLVVTKYFVKEGPSIIRRLLTALGAYSFGIFLIHPMVINYLDFWFVWEGSYWFHLGIILRFILTIVISYMIVELVKRYIPLSNYIVGR